MNELQTKGGMIMRKRWSLALTLVLIISCLLGGSVLAFNDLDSRADKDILLTMKDKGLISGADGKHFNPEGKLTNAEGIQLIVKGFDLNIDNLRFIKEPKASDYFKNVSDDAWYAQTFIIAQFNLQLPQDMSPNAVMTREEFAHYLFTGMMTKGEFAFIELYMLINDEDQVNADYMNAIQKLLITKVIELDKDSNLHPKSPITRAEAAVLTYKAMDVVKNLLEQQATVPPIDENVQMTVEKVTDEVNKVTVSWGEQPNTGYGITIDRIEFSEGIATIVYSLHYPEPDKMYAQVIEEKTAVTYVSSAYEPVIAPGRDRVQSSKSTSSVGLAIPMNPQL